MLRNLTAALYLSAALLTVPAFAASAPAIKVNPNLGPPTSQPMVNGRKFGAKEAVDLYLDATDDLLIETSAKGAFAPQKLTIPANATPGTHWVTAIGRTTGDMAQKPFVVRTDWPQFGFSALGGRQNPFENVVGTANAGQLATAWTAPFNTSSSAAVVGSVAYIGSGDANLYALDAATGAQKWKFPTSGSIASSPAVDGGDVFFGSDDHFVYGLTALGAPFWTTPFQANDKIESSPVVADQKVFIGSDDKNLYALKEKDGTKLWFFPTQGVIRSIPAVANGLVYVTSFDDTLYAINETTGNKAWSFTTGDAIAGSPVVVNGSVYVGSSDGLLYAFNAVTGAKLWQFNTQASIVASPALANGIVYIGTTNGMVYAIDARLGTQLWKVTLNASLNYSVTSSSLTVANGVLYFGDIGGYIYALNASNGTSLWFAVVPTSIYGAPTFSDGVLYVGSHDANGHGTFVAYAINGNASKRANPLPPPVASLRPDRKLPLVRD
jgi:outer membrane protein assembly factor BamB